MLHSNVTEDPVGDAALQNIGQHSPRIIVSISLEKMVPTSVSTMKVKETMAHPSSLSVRDLELRTHTELGAEPLTFRYALNYSVAVRNEIEGLLPQGANSNDRLVSHPPDRSIYPGDAVVPNFTLLNVGIFCCLINFIPLLCATEFLFSLSCYLRGVPSQANLSISRPSNCPFKG